MKNFRLLLSLVLGFIISSNGLVLSQYQSQSMINFINSLDRRSDETTDLQDANIKGIVEKIETQSYEYTFTKEGNFASIKPKRGQELAKYHLYEYPYYLLEGKTKNHFGFYLQCPIHGLYDQRLSARADVWNPLGSYGLIHNDYRDIYFEYNEEGLLTSVSMSGDKYPLYKYKYDNHRHLVTRFTLHYDNFNKKNEYLPLIKIVWKDDLITDIIRYNEEGDEIAHLKVTQPYSWNTFRCEGGGYIDRDEGTYKYDRITHYQYNYGIYDIEYGRFEDTYLVTKITDTLSKPAKSNYFFYDDEGNLSKTVINGETIMYSYTYDSHGNWTNMTKYLIITGDIEIKEKIGEIHRKITYYE